VYVSMMASAAGMAHTTTRRAPRGIRRRVALRSDVAIDPESVITATLTSVSVIHKIGRPVPGYDPFVPSLSTAGPARH
jgi:hypothetical protein